MGIYYYPSRNSFANDVSAAFVPHPDFMDSAGVDIDAVPDRVRFLLWLGVLRIGDGQLTVED